MARQTVRHRFTDRVLFRVNQDGPAGACLYRANQNRTVREFTDLRGADLCGADLSGAYLAGAAQRGAWCTTSAPAGHGGSGRPGTAASRWKTTARWYRQPPPPAAATSPRPDGPPGSRVSQHPVTNSERSGGAVGIGRRGWW